MKLVDEGRNGQRNTPIVVARPTASLTSQERSARVDALVVDVADHVRAINANATAQTETRKTVEGLIARVNEIEQQRAAERSARPQSFMARLRLLILGHA